MLNYFYREQTPTSVEAQNAFERFYLTFSSVEEAKTWHGTLTSALDSVLKRTIGSKCEICFGPLRPAYCCHCIKCDRVCCEECCEYINSHDRKTSSKNMVCPSCLQYNDRVLGRNPDVQRLLDSRNSADGERFVQPVFVCNMETQQELELPEGWKACMLADSRVYYVNVKKWLSSWSLPKQEFENDAPYGWQKYFGEKDAGFYYRAKDHTTRFDRPLVPVSSALGCPCCEYIPSQSDVERDFCPCCNTSLKEVV